MTRTEAYMALNSVRLIGPVRVRKLLDVFGSPEAILSQPVSRLAGVDGIGQAVAESIQNWEKSWDLGDELKRVEALGLRVVDVEDAAYPKALRAIYDPPLVLYAKGSLEAVSRPGMALVGSRHTSHYGMETARKLGYQLGYAGLTVISGLARGIDTAAHQGALAAKGKTVAVFGCSLDTVYPPENNVLAERIVEDGGVLLSEFPLGTPPDRQTFPMRNRIVSGLSRGVVVVEAGQGSGALITARMALEQGRTVFAVPGRIDQPYSKGCHQLIKEGAKLVEEVGDILGEFEFLFSEVAQPAPRPGVEQLSEAERKVFEVLGVEELHVDVIIRKCGLPSGVVQSNLLRLEMRKLARQLPGRFYVRTG
ncbi:MAG: DNA-processing protein DprA [Candidatus Methylacidiphilales bacterium]